jgi:hypothetical protein
MTLLNETMSSILNPTNSDSEAGNWKPYLYQHQQMNCRSSATKDQRDQEFPREYNRRTKNSINYWNVGSVLRWNEI